MTEHGRGGDVRLFAVARLNANYQLTRKTPFEPKFFSLTNSLRLGLRSSKRRLVGTTIEIYFIGHSQHPPS
jgi:hypothetical protein